MNRTTRTWICVATVGTLIASGAYAQKRRHGHSPEPAPSAPAEASRLITVPVTDALSMMQQQRVFLFTPPAGSSAYGVGMLGEGGHKVWALLPSCRRPNPDDPRDPCPVGRVSMEAIGTDKSIPSNEPQTIGNSPDSRRVQSFVVPEGVEQLRIKILRRDDHVRYEAAVRASQLGNLPAPAGHGSGPSQFAFDLARYPAL